MIDIPNRVDDQRAFLFGFGIELFRQFFEAGIGFGPRLAIAR
jgi:hypothetical protein